MKIGLVLGVGSARGWAHIGVIRALARHGIVPDMIAGTSIGALVGAAWVMGRLDPLEAWVRQLNWPDVVRLLDIRLAGGGLIAGERLIERLGEWIPETDIADCPRPYAAVATNLETGNEVWLREGSLRRAVRASIALPGVFTPVMIDGHWMIDGGLVNPVPVSLCRAMGADLIIAVDLNSDVMQRHPLEIERDGPADDSTAERLLWGAKTALGRLIGRGESENPELPSLIDVVARTVNIMSIRITRSRMAGDPPDIVVSPRLADIGLMEFHRAAESIAEGEAAVERAADELGRLGLGGR